MNRKNAGSISTHQKKRNTPAISNLYGLIAVILVIIPEWLAEITLAIGNSQTKSRLPQEGTAWSKKPELLLASMSIKCMRQLAAKLKVIEYSRDSKDILYQRLLRKLKEKPYKIKAKKIFL